MSTARGGFGLLEVIAALVILSVSGVSALVMTAESVETIRKARALEKEMREANAFLEAVALWTRDDFDRRLGERRQGPWFMYTEKINPSLYEVVLKDTVSGAVLLETKFYRPEPRR